MPWDERWVARVRGILRHEGRHAGSLVLDDTDHNRSTAAHTRAHRSTLHATDSGGSVWGQRLVFLGVVPPTLSRPGGVVCSQPAPAWRAWDKQATALQPHGVPPKPRPSPPPAHPRSPTTHALALSVRAPWKTQPPAGKVNGLTAEARSGPASCGDGASARCGGVQVLAPIRSTQTVRLPKRAQHGSDSWATHPGPPPTLRLRGGHEGVAIVGSARGDVGAQTTTRCGVALQDEGDAPSRSLSASALTWRTLALVQGQTLRGLVAGCSQAWQSSAGWSQLPTPPGGEGARHSGILRLLVEQALWVPPDHHAQLPHHLPASTVGSLRAPGHVAGLVDGVERRVSSAAPQEHLQRCTHA